MYKQKTCQSLGQSPLKGFLQQLRQQGKQRHQVLMDKQGKWFE